jgi:ketosteroid isomerase-like protein
VNTGTAAVERLYAAINRNDLDAIAALFDPEIVRIEFEGSASAGTYRGIANVCEHIAKGRNRWAEGACEAERLRVSGDKVVAYVRVHVRLRDSGEWLAGRLADGFEFRGGKIVRFVSFIEAAEALRWAGLQE